MRIARRAFGIAAAVLSLTGVAALAQGQAQGQGAATESAATASFRGVVVNVNAMAMSVKGELLGSGTAPGAAAGKTGASKKADLRNVVFFIKEAKITRGGWRPCELKEVQKGDTVTITFTPPSQRGAKILASQVDVDEDRPAEKRPLLAEMGTMLFADDFAREELAPKWRPGKGFWSIQEGVVSVAENPDDAHPAYAYVSTRFPYKDIVAEFSFKFDGAKTCNLMMEDNTYKEAHAGHIIRASVSPTSVSLVDSKFGAMKNEIHDKMKDPQTTAEEKQKIQASIKDKSASFKITLDPEKWHEARVEVVGDEMLMSIDNQPAGYFKSEGVDHPTKNMIGFSVGGKTMLLDNLRVWAATPRADWEKNRETVQAALKKP